MFSDSDREIYLPAIESRPLGRFDPLAVKRKLVIASGGRLNSLLDEWEGDDELQAAKAEDQLVAAARSAFNFEPITTSENGVADADVLDVLADFLEFLAGKREPHSGSPTTSPCAEPGG